MTNIEKSVKQVVEPIINNLGYKVYDVIYEKEGQDNYLRIFIDKDGTIDLNDCEAVNNAITDVLDEKDLIKNQYMLEVSSPGLERRIRDDEQLKANINNLIEIHTYKKMDYSTMKDINNSDINKNEEANDDNHKTKKVKNSKTKNSTSRANDRIVQGLLDEFDDNSVTIIVNNEKLKIEKDNISSIKTVYDWDG